MTTTPSAPSEPRSPSARRSAWPGPAPAHGSRSPPAGLWSGSARGAPPASGCSATRSPPARGCSRSPHRAPSWWPSPPSGPASVPWPTGPPAWWRCAAANRRRYGHRSAPRARPPLACWAGGRRRWSRGAANSARCWTRWHRWWRPAAPGWSPCSGSQASARAACWPSTATSRGLPVETGARPLAWRQGRSPPYGAMAFLPLAQVVRAEAAILETDTAEQAERKLRRTVNAVLSEQRDPEAVGWMTGQLLRLVGGAVQVGATRPLEDGDSSEEMLGVWRRFLYALAGKRPLVLAVEDAQWADPALLDFLESLADPQLAPAAGSAPLLVIVTARPELAERRPRLGGRQRAAGTTIRLEPLSDADTAALLAALLDHHGLAPEVGPELLARAGGNPLSAEEYVRMVRDRGASLRAPGGGTLPVPETVHGIVATRLDALPAAEKAVLQDAAVLGPAG